MAKSKCSRLDVFWVCMYMCDFNRYEMIFIIISKEGFRGLKFAGRGVVKIGDIT